MPKLIQSDNGTNYKGAEKELNCLSEISKQKKFKNFILKQEIEWQWIFNTPAAPHHGGAWERLIQSIKKTLLAVSGGELSNLDEEQQETLFCLVESIINSRPITHNSDDVRDAEALTPNHLLLLRRGPQALGTFDRSDVYGRRWRQVQWLASSFWRRWLKEYIPSLETRNKQTKPEQNLRIDDLVLLADEQTPRSVWPLGRVVEAIKGRDGLVRTVKVKTGSNLFVRPVSKVVLLERIEEY